MNHLFYVPKHRFCSILKTIKEMKSSLCLEVEQKWSHRNIHNSPLSYSLPCPFATCSHNSSPLKLLSCCLCSCHYNKWNRMRRRRNRRFFVPLCAILLLLNSANPSSKKRQLACKSCLTLKKREYSTHLVWRPASVKGVQVSHRMAAKIK